MRQIDMSKYDIRTDLIVDLISDSNPFEKKTVIDSVTISNVILDEENASFLNKDPGCYTTIYFDDITDSTNYDKVLNAMISELSKILDISGIEDNYSCMIVGLGNEKSTADELGVSASKKVIVTKHIYDLTGSLDDGFRITTCLVPGVMGTTGIETSDIISSVVEKVSPDFIIVIDALTSGSIDRLLKTIQITNTGIKPGSGIGNNRKEISSKIYGVPVIAIGVPTVVEASTIVNDTLNYMKKHFSYSIKNNNKFSDRLIPYDRVNYLKNNHYNLSASESFELLGMVGNLSDFEKKMLIHDVLSPIGYNLIVTPKEIDFVVMKLSDLISEAINKTIHNISTKT